MEVFIGKLPVNRVRVNFHGTIPIDFQVGEHVEQVAAAAPSTSDWRMVLYHDRNVAGRIFGGNFYPVDFDITGISSRFLMGFRWPLMLRTI